MRKGHSYDAQICAKTRFNSDCPFCTGRKVLAGYNDLLTTHSHILKEWDYNRNDLKPTEVAAGTPKKVWWLCEKGHSWEAYIFSRAINGSQCPYCCSRPKKVAENFNDLVSKYPELLKEWDYSINDVLPSEITVGTSKKVWWICPFSRSYSCTPYRRVVRRIGCTVCAKEGRTSFAEQSVFYYIKKKFQDAINSDTDAIGMELDIFIPSIKTAVEYDGVQWHTDNKREEKKNSLCRKKDIKLIRIRETGLTIYDDCICIINQKTNNDETLEQAIREMLFLLNISNTDINIDRDRIDIYNQYIVNCKEKSLEKRRPDIASEWNYRKNGSLKPSMISSGSGKKVWWLGPCNHEYQMSVAGRTAGGSSCPYCSGHRVLIGFNDFESQAATNLLEEWDYEKNTLINPKSIHITSNKKVWWKCSKCGYKWIVGVQNRTRYPSGCPQCCRYKPVRNIDTGIEYDSAKTASEETGISRNQIGAACRGVNKTAGGVSLGVCST